MTDMADRLKWARREAGFENAVDAARALGVEVPTYLGHENGSRGFRKSAELYARRFGVNLEWLLTSRGRPKSGQPNTVPALGYVGAGQEILPIDDHAIGAGLEEAELPPGAPLDAILVIVRGESMYPRYFDGEYLFYQRDQRQPAEFVGRECVLKLSDGRMFVKVLRRGDRAGKFNLESWNGPTLENQSVEWAAPVVARVNRQRKVPAS